MRKALWPIALLVMGMFANSKEQSYQNGTLTRVSDFRLDVGLSLGSARVCCIWQIQAKESTYSVGVTERPEKFGWAIDSSIQFRVEKRNVFLKRPNGKELRATLLKVVPVVGKSSLSTQMSFTTGDHFELPPPLPGPSKFNPVVPLELDLLSGANSCVQVSANLWSGDFFKAFENKRTAYGRQFHNNSGTVKVFPEKLTIRVLISLLPCLHSEGSAESGGGIQPEFTFDKSFIGSLRFEGFWKKGLDMKKADLRLLTQAQTCPPLPTGGNACSWEYELNVWCRDVPLTDVLVIEILSGDGQVVTRFSSSNLVKN